LVGRSAIDKILTLRGGPELVAYWAQLSTVVELVAAVALAGVGGGLVVLVAQTDRPERQYALLAESLRSGFALAVPAMLVVGAICLAFPEAIGDRELPAALLILGAATGCIGVVTGMVSNYWLGQQRRDLLLALSVAGTALSAGVAIATPRDWLLAALCAAGALPALALFFVRRPATNVVEPESRQDREALRRYILVGISIGVLSPGSTIAIRSIVANALSWESAGYLQALWRVADWVAALAGGVLGVYFLPRLSSAWQTLRFSAELRLAALATMAPSAAALALVYAFHPAVFALLYDPGFRMSDTVVALFFGGTLLRIAAWVALFALYAMRRTLAISVGEVLSLPLFAALLALASEGLTLERAGVSWLASYAAFLAFNAWAASRGPRRHPGEPPDGLRQAG
jgi:PST family polysaccharide transporter